MEGRPSYEDLYRTDTRSSRELCNAEYAPNYIYTYLYVRIAFEPFLDIEFSNPQSRYTTSRFQFPDFINRSIQKPDIQHFRTHKSKHLKFKIP